MKVWDLRNKGRAVLVDRDVSDVDLLHTVKANVCGCGVVFPLLILRGGVTFHDASGAIMGVCPNCGAETPYAVTKAVNMRRLTAERTKEPVRRHRYSYQAGDTPKQCMECGAESDYEVCSDEARARWAARKVANFRLRVWCWFQGWRYKIGA